MSGVYDIHKTRLFIGGHEITGFISCEVTIHSPEETKRQALAAMKTEEDVKKADGRLFKGPADTRALIHRLHQIRKGAL